MDKPPTTRVMDSLDATARQDLIGKLHAAPTSAAAVALLFANAEVRNQLSQHLSGESFADLEKLAGSEADDAVTVPSSRTAVEAALNLDYVLDDAVTAQERAWLLANSVVVPKRETRALRLHPEARAQILLASAAQVHRREYLEQAQSGDSQPEADEDPSRLAGRMLRMLLRGENLYLNGMNSTELRALLTARNALSRLPEPMVSSEACRRKLELSELLDPLRISIGWNGAGSTATDRFVGRRDELRDLRAFVDVLKSESMVESVLRGISYASNFGRRANLYSLVAPGGLGKSALIAKFVLSHVFDPYTSFPFAYLDFERASLQAADCLQLLLETVRQISCQYEDLEAEFQQLRAEIRKDIANGDSSLLPKHCQSFRVILSRILEPARNQTFLLVLDTVEIPQRDKAAMAGIRQFLSELANEGFGKLSVVTAGRADFRPHELELSERYDVQYKKLEALSPDDARAMVERLGQVWMAGSWNASWTAKVCLGPDFRREPLTLRLVMELLRDAKETRARVDILSKLDDIDGEVADKFVGGLYERRIQDHIADDNARLLAWPGLVVRRITREIAMNVVAPLCGLTPQQADCAFDKLACEVWVVEQEKGALIHRRDLRARTLPLMRRGPKAELFKKIVQAMIDYHTSRAATSPADTVEAAYYRLLQGDSSEFREQDSWDLAGKLADAVDDFEEGSPGWSVLTARFEKRLLQAGKFAKLEPYAQWEHARRTGSELLMLEEQHVDPRVNMLMANGEKSGSGEGVEAYRRALRIKAGAWSALGPRRVSLWHEDVRNLELFYAARMGKSDQELDDLVFDMLHKESYGVEALVNALIYARRTEHKLWAELDSNIVRLYINNNSVFPENYQRLAMLFGTRCLEAMWEGWTSSEIERITSRGSSMSLSEHVVLVQLGYFYGSPVPDSISTEYAVFFEQPTAAHPKRRFRNDQIAMFGAQVLGVARAKPTSESSKLLRRYLALRQSDWLTPCAYALACCVRHHWHKMALKIGDPYQAESSFFRKLVAYGEKPPENLLDYLRWCDRAGDIDGGILRLEPEITDDLRVLLNALDSWRNELAARAIDRPS